VLFMMFGEVKVGSIVFSRIPFALTGSILAL
jgi:Cu/Ag efflux pump CusA